MSTVEGGDVSPIQKPDSARGDDRLCTLTDEDLSIARYFMLTNEDINVIRQYFLDTVKSSKCSASAIIDSLDIVSNLTIYSIMRIVSCNGVLTFSVFFKICIYFLLPPIFDTFKLIYELYVIVHQSESFGKFLDHISSRFMTPDQKHSVENRFNLYQSLLLTPLRSYNHDINALVDSFQFCDEVVPFFAPLQEFRRRLEEKVFSERMVGRIHKRLENKIFLLQYHEMHGSFPKPCFCTILFSGSRNPFECDYYLPSQWEEEFVFPPILPYSATQRNSHAVPELSRRSMIKSRRSVSTKILKPDSKPPALKLHFNTSESRSFLNHSVLQSPTTPNVNEGISLTTSTPNATDELFVDSPHPLAGYTSGAHSTRMITVSSISTNMSQLKNSASLHNHNTATVQLETTGVSSNDLPSLPTGVSYSGSSPIAPETFSSSQSFFPIEMQASLPEAGSCRYLGVTGDRHMNRAVSASETGHSSTIAPSSSKIVHVPSQSIRYLKRSSMDSSVDSMHRDSGGKEESMATLTTGVTHSMSIMESTEEHM